MARLVEVFKLESRVAITTLLCTAMFGLHLVGCGDNENSNLDGATGGAGGAGGTSLDSGAGGSLLDSGSSGSDGGLQDGGDAEVCAAKSATGDLSPVYLAFAFDVSGSMGEKDYPWHDPVLKWEPVVAATEAFFAAPASAGISASLTFFPALAEKCSSSTYAKPDVPMTLLPSNAFSAAITAITPKTAADWRGGTPTLAVLQGTFAYIAGTTKPSAKAIYAVVLVTDGYPQDCDDDKISSVVAEVAAHASVYPTYVIGVANPPLPNAPDTVSDLNAIAVAGGTSKAFILATGDPVSTKNAFSKVINDIRGQTVSCNIQIPSPPAGQVFDRTKVTVLKTIAGVQSALVYNTTCAKDNAWHYDDPANPKAIVLCQKTCDAITAAPDASILVQFGCEVVIDVK